ncbi:MAG: siroheme synthase CysG [Gammaproteobacteria bacterium]|nr:siroheme synthase CysG [Gammaproteobacteria bacterium]
MKQFPVFLNLQNRPCLVVGGGEVAARKVRLLRGAGACVTVISPTLCPALEEMVASQMLAVEARRFRADDLGSYVLIVAATGEAKLNEEISVMAKQRNIPVNVVDQPKLCTFTVPSIVDRDPVVIAVSTGGASPVLARLLRARLETLVPASYGKLAELVAGFRQQVRERFSGTERRRRFWEEVLQGPVAELLLSGREDSAREALQQAIEESTIGPLRGEVYLVGAGPGDPDLLTFRALRLLQQADVVLYDRLVTPEILDMTRRDAERIYVGKARADHSVPQPQINELLVTLAQQGKRVLRLKGGDPFIFGRGGEEIDRLAEENIPFQVVPGITAASGCAAYAGIPLTHRDYAQSCIFVTGHLKDHSVNLNWDALAQPKQTVVIYMSLTGLPIICESLIQHGLHPTLPAALVEQGTTPHQRVLTGTLATLPGLVDAADVHAPTLVIVGEVVKLRAKLSWFGPDAGAVPQHP